MKEFDLSVSESDWADIRAEYLKDPEEIYLNTGSWGVQPRPVFEKYTHLLRELELNPTRGRGPLREELGDSRRTFADFLNIQAQDIAFLPNVTAAINLVVNGMRWESGDQILTTDQEYGAVLNCLHNATVRWGVELVTAQIDIPPSRPDDILKPLEAAITPRTKLIVVSHITTGTGMITPIREISDLAHRHGVLVAYDGAHAPGMIHTDLEASGADFYGGNCHKWLCSPKGVGFLYANPAVQELLRHLIVSWGYSKEGMKQAEERPEINGSPAMYGFEAWGTTDLAGQAAVGEAVRFQQQIGVKEIEQRGRDLSAHVRERVADLSWMRVRSPSTDGMFGSITTCEMDGMGGKGLGDTLYRDHRITIPVFEEGDDAAVRVSTHLYNTFEEVDKLFDVLIDQKGS